MKPFDRAALVVCFILLPFLSPANSGDKKGETGSSNDPFAGKLMRHRPVESNMDQLGRVEQELKQLARKVAEFKAGTGKSSELQSSNDQLISIDRLNRINGAPVKVVWSEKDPIPIFIQGTRLQNPFPTVLGKVTNEFLVQRAIEFLVENARLLRIERPVQEFELTEFDRDELGLTHIRFQQKYEGLEVWGQDVRVHVNSEGTVEAFNGRYIPTPKFLKIPDAGVDELTARRIALEALGSSADETLSRKLIYVGSELYPRLAWLVQLRKGLDENWQHFIDAETGATLKRYNHVIMDGPVNGTGTDLLNQTRNLKIYQIGSTYYMIDASKPMFSASQSTFPHKGKGVVYTYDAKNADSTLYYVTSSNLNSWSDKASVSASANGALVFDYYKQVHERNAIDNQGSTMYVVINFKRNYNNAFWNGQLMVFGNGDGNNFSDLAAALDVTAHEMTHGVVERTANLVYENQAGALNESFADVFGVMFEFWVKGANGNWLIGEDVTTPAVSADALRDMENPGSSKVAFNGQQPAHMSQYKNLPNTPEGDNGGVHVNSGIPNKAFYLFATDAAVGRDKAEKVYYRALTQYLTRNSQFVDCRLAVIKAAEDLYGAGGAVAVAAGQAFDAVGISSGSTTPPPPSLPPVQGQPYLAVVATANGLLYRTGPDGSNIQPLTTTPLSSRPAPADNGALIFYIDNENNLHVISSSGGSDQKLSTQGGFANVAISPNGRYLAATTTFQIPQVYVFDLQSSSGDKIFQLYTPTYSQGATGGTVRFPDRIDWAANSQMLMYDTYNTVVGGSGDTTGYWDINLLRITDGAISRLFPPQPRGIDIGNAVFANNTDNYIAFDFVDENRQVKVLAVNLITGAAGVVTDNYSSLGSPSFSSDDKKVYYHYIDANGASVWVVDLKQDGVTGSGNDQNILSNAFYPVSFTVGTRPTDVESDETVVPASFSLEQNYPNPFNPSTTIQFALPRSAYAKLSVYDLLGREITVLVDQELGAGRHSVRFDAQSIPSGVYVYQLRSGEFREARKFVVVK